MTGTNEKRVIGLMSEGPSSYTEKVIFTHPGGSAELRYTYERDGRMYAGGLRFMRVRAYQFRSESHCTSWYFDAYDTLVEVEQSDWVRELHAAEPSVTGGIWKIRHFLIYIDGAGAYEVAAEDYEWLPGDPA